MPCALPIRSEEHTSELQSPCNLVCRVLFRSDRKSTRLNSSHLVISYAVFCLKKKKNLSRGLWPAGPLTMGHFAARVGAQPLPLRSSRRHRTGGPGQQATTQGLERPQASHCIQHYFVIEISRPKSSSAISTLLNFVCASICSNSARV